MEIICEIETIIDYETKSSFDHLITIDLVGFFYFF